MQIRMMLEDSGMFSTETTSFEQFHPAFQQLGRTVWVCLIQHLGKGTLYHRASFSSLYNFAYWIPRTTQQLEIMQCVSIIAMFQRYHVTCPTPCFTVSSAHGYWGTLKWLLSCIFCLELYLLTYMNHLVSGQNSLCGTWMMSEHPQGSHIAKSGHC